MMPDGGRRAESRPSAGDTTRTVLRSTLVGTVTATSWLEGGLQRDGCPSAMPCHALMQCRRQDRNKTQFHEEQKSPMGHGGGGETGSGWASPVSGVDGAMPAN